MEKINFLNDTKYAKWYTELMNTRSLLTRSKKCSYFESHHIVPRCVHDNKNTVLLTAREHYIAHLLLMKACLPQYKKSLVYAFMSMRRSPNGNNKRKNTSRLYEKHKKYISREMSGSKNPFYGKGFYGKDNPFYGKTHTKETIEKIKKANADKYGPKNSFYGKTHSEKTKQKISKRNSKPVKITYKDGKTVHLSGTTKIGPHIGKSVSYGARMFSENITSWMKIHNIERIDYENKIN